MNMLMAHKLIVKQVAVFVARKETDGEHYGEACSSIASGSFKGVSLLPTAGKERIICKKQFYQALSDSLTSRLLDAGDKDLISRLSILDPNSLSDELPPEYGEDSIKIMCDRFVLHFSDVKTSYRIYKESGGRDLTPPLQKLFSCLNTVLVSTAACERGFSKMNILCSPLRSRLTVKHLSVLMFVSIVGPPLKLFQPLRYVQSWLALKRRDANCTNSKVVKRNESTSVSGQISSLWSSML